MAALNTQLAGIGESFTVALSDKVRQLKAAGKNVTGLQTGDPDFDTPPLITAAAQRALASGYTHYGDSRGMPALRQAISATISGFIGADYAADREVLVTNGAIHAYYTALQAILSPGDEVLIPDPAWQTHPALVRVLHGVPVRVPTYAEHGFMPTFDAWQRQLSARTVALVINSPNNPTGAVASAAYMTQLVAFAEANGLYIISDEVYDHLIYTGEPHVSPASIPGGRARTLLLNSFSKTYAMTGWRVGYLAAPADVIDQSLKASQYSITNVAPFVQHGALEALTNPAVQTDVQRMVAAYTRRRAAVLESAAARGESAIVVTAPAGSFYFFLDLRALNMSANEMAARLLSEAGVSVVPGSAYGERGEGFLRMTIAASDDEVTQGFNAIADWADRQ